MLTNQDLLAIDKLIQKRNLESEKRLEKKILNNKGYLLKIINFLDRNIMSLTKRMEKIERNSNFS